MGRRVMIVVAWALGGLAVALMLTFGAFALAGQELSKPASAPIFASTRSHPGDAAGEDVSPSPEPDVAPSASPSSDDRGGGSGDPGSGSDDDPGSDDGSSSDDRSGSDGDDSDDSDDSDDD